MNKEGPFATQVVSFNWLCNAGHVHICCLVISLIYIYVHIYALFHFGNDSLYGPDLSNRTVDLFCTTFTVESFAEVYTK
jgi:hypothetical protein